MARMFWWFIPCLGLLPAGVILTLLSFTEDGMSLLGHAVGEIPSPSRLLAALASIFRPILILVPLALAWRPCPEHGPKVPASRHLVLQAALLPWLLLLPALLSAWLKGLSPIGLGFLHLLSLSALSLLLHGWAQLSSRLLSGLPFWLTWSALWAWSQFGEYLAPLLDFLDLALLQPLIWLNAVTPPLSRGFSLSDSLGMGVWPAWRELTGLLLQAIFLLALPFLKPVVQGTHTHS
jgi:hypothetical protein